MAAAEERCCSAEERRRGPWVVGAGSGSRHCEEAEGWPGGSCGTTTRLPPSTVEAGNHATLCEDCHCVLFDVHTAPNVASGSLSKPIPFLHFFVSLRAALLV